MAGSSTVLLHGNVRYVLQVSTHTSHSDVLVVANFLPQNWNWFMWCETGWCNRHYRNCVTQSHTVSHTVSHCILVWYLDVFFHHYSTLQLKNSFPYVGLRLASTLCIAFLRKKKCFWSTPLNGSSDIGTYRVAAAITKFAGGSTKYFGTYHAEVSTKPKKI